MNIDHPKPQELGGLKMLWKEAFGDTDAQISLFFDTAFAPERSLCATENGEVAAALYWLDCSYPHGRLAYIYAVATAKAHRGKGLCRALMEKTHELLKAQGYAGAVLVPAQEELFTLYEKMGYQRLDCADTLRCTAEGEIALKKCSPAEFFAAREALLPQGGVSQNHLDYIAGYAGLYAGEGFTCIASIEGEKLVAMELLGDKTVAPKIVNALGCAEGSFRVKGSGRFAMWQPFHDLPAPEYFGIAYD